MPPAPIPAGGADTSAIGSLLAGGDPAMQGADEMQAQLESLAGSVRDIATQVDALAMDLPNAAPKVDQIKNLLKQIVLDAAKAMPPATASGQAVPTGASMGPGPV